MALNSRCLSLICIFASRGIVEYSVMGTTCDLLQGTSDHELVKK